MSTAKLGRGAVRYGVPLLGLGGLMVALFMILLGGTAPATDTPTAGLTTFIHTSPDGPCTNGDQVYSVTAKIDVNNTSSDVITIAEVGFTATATGPNGTSP